MCCFSRPVQSVANTQIFARRSKDGHQFLVYRMSFNAAEDLAMVLPLPVPKGVKEDAVRFIDLHEYTEFFTDLKAGFPEPQPRNMSRSKGPIAAVASAPLAVVNVGSFEASFVPALADFARLDERFRMPKGVWEKLPAYQNFGFAVFKLKKESRSVHPMAFEFPSRLPGLFFPTVHIHDGQVHPKAHFDHALYAQAPNGESGRFGKWKESPQVGSQFLDVKRAKGIFDASQHCYLQQLRGDLKNQDTVV